MHLLRYIAITMALAHGFVVPMDFHADLILGLLWRHGSPTHEPMYSLALVCKSISTLAVQYFKHKEKELEDDYKALLTRKDFTHCALVRLSRNREAYGCIGVKLVNKKTSSHGEHYAVYLVRAKKFYFDAVATIIRSSSVIIGTYGDPELEDKKYPWIEDFKSVGLSGFMPPLKYRCCGIDGMSGPVTIARPFFKMDGSLAAAVDFEGDMLPTISRGKHLFVIHDRGGRNYNVMPEEDIPLHSF